MKTNLDFLDTGSFLYVFIAVAIFALVLWSFLHEAVKPLFAFFKKVRPKQNRAPNVQPKIAQEHNWKSSQSPGFQFTDESLNRKLKPQ
jgi:hypothetical protein